MAKTTRTYTKPTEVLVISPNELMDLFGKHFQAGISDYADGSNRIRIALTSGGLIEVEELLLEMAQRFATKKSVRDAIKGFIDELKLQAEKERAAAYARIREREEQAKKDRLERARRQLRSPYVMDATAE